jgi:hypothetical protein
LAARPRKAGYEGDFVPYPSTQSIARHQKVARSFIPVLSSLPFLIMLFLPQAQLKIPCSKLQGIFERKECGLFL